MERRTAERRPTTPATINQIGIFSLIGQSFLKTIPITSDAIGTAAEIAKSMVTITSKNKNKKHDITLLK